MSCLFPALACAALLAPAPAHAAGPLPQLRAYEVREAWRQPVAPVRIARNTWHIGTAGLSALLVTGKDGAILIDGGMPQAADHLLANLAALGLQPSQVKWIVHSQAHADHVGPLAAVKRATGARVASNAESAALLARGGADDLHFGDGMLYHPLQVDRLLQDGELLELGDLRLQVHFTPGHTPGSMSWSWNDIGTDGAPVRIVYADSLSAPGYRLLDNPRYPRIVEDFRRSIATLRALPCDLLLTPHPEASGWRYDASPVRERELDCRGYADAAGAALDAQIEKERAAR
ncbi:POM family subclass B3 metallo-beta-lactamase [Lysobacteraceae bacterium NML91-0213]|nr:POM family subclass B3 metallo-beta-lactamase [Xanthomonadaceae bacterium NML91-0213]